MAKATSHFKLGESDAAISLLKEAELLDPNDPSPKSALSIIYEELGQDTLALDYFAKARDLHYFTISKKRRQTMNDNARNSPRPHRNSRSARLGGIFSSDFRFQGGELDQGEDSLVLGKGHFKYSLLTDNSQTINKLLTRFSSVAFRQDRGSVELFFRLGFALYREFIRRRAENGKDLPLELKYALSLPSIEAQLNFSCPALLLATLCKLPLFHWLAFFTHLSQTLARYERHIDAQQVLRNVEKNTCMRAHEQPRLYLLLLAMGIADNVSDYNSLSDHLRYLFGENNPCFHGDIYTFYMAVMAMGRAKQNTFGSCTNFRFFNRAARRLEKANPSKAHYAASQYLLGHMVCSSRSFTKSLSYFFNAHKEFPDDPAICLSLAIAYQHIAFQRNTTNRHIQILQSFTYLIRYGKIKGFNQEVRYNFGRAFHRLALFNLAIPHYEAALAFSDRSHQLRNQGLFNSPEIIPLDQDLSFEAAYNLSLIYHQIGSPGLADMYVQKYCVV
ncbi:transcription factor TFIIIC subunit tfc4 [Entomophthora muscae]|nr:transcription factor TFIIIC subunit tfc4 [Entomophthora muscae]